MEMPITPRYANGSSAGVRASSGRRQAPVRATSTRTMSLRRSTRSTTCPAIGVTMKIGNDWQRSISDASVAEPVSCRTRSSSATVRNQSPPSEINVPT